MASKKYNGEKTVISTNGVAITVYPYGKNIEPGSLLYTICKNLSKMNHRSKASRKIKIGKCLHSLGISTGCLDKTPTAMTIKEKYW